MNIEPLEPRIAPASVLTFIDVDGDKVTLKSTVGDLTAPGVATFLALGAGQQLQMLTLTDVSFQDASLTTSVTKVVGGDGVVNIGRIDATGRDLASVTIKGDLGAIDAGNGNPDAPALKLLSVRTLGRFGLSTQGGAGDLESDLDGALGMLKVAGDLKDAFIRVNGGADGTIGAVTIGGSLIGGSADNSGSLQADGKFTGPVKIGRDVHGGAGASSGTIYSLGAGIGNVSLGGSLIGGAGGFSGRIFGNTGLGDVKIGGDVIGGGTTSGGGLGDNGFIQAGSGSIKSVTIAGSLIGGHGDYSGTIAAATDLNTTGNIGFVKIGGSVIGGTASQAGTIIVGAFLGSGDLGPVTIGGDVIGGPGFNNGCISATGGRMAGVTIGGSLIGGSVGINNGTIGEITTGSFSIYTASLGAISIAGDVRGGGADESGKIQSAGSIDSVTIGGSLVGGTDLVTDAFAQIKGGNIGPVKIGGDVVGTGSDKSAGIQATGTLASVSIGGSLFGGSNADSGEILSSLDMGAVKIGHDVQGGAGTLSGIIRSAGKLAGVSIGGSIIGGSNSSSGEIFSTLDMGAVKIGRNLVGGSITGAAALDRSGTIESGGRIASVTIGGSIIAGTDNSSGALTRSASIRAGDDIGALTVKGGLFGNASTNGDSLVVISARGQATPGAASDVAIGKVSIAGRVEYARILAGYDVNLSAVNGDGSIGAVSVGGDWVASSLVAGVRNLGADGMIGGTGANADNANFGDIHDEVIPTGNGGILSRIASIVIKGAVAGTTASGDHFGFVAQQIGAFKSLGFSAPLTAATNVIEISPITADATYPQGDVTLREV